MPSRERRVYQMPAEDQDLHNGVTSPPLHPVAVGLWKKQFLERGAELFDASGKNDHAERRIAELEQLLGKKEVELALLKNFLRPVPCAK